MIVVTKKMFLDCLVGGSTVKIVMDVLKLSQRIKPEFPGDYMYLQKQVLSWHAVTFCWTYSSLQSTIDYHKSCIFYSFFLEYVLYFCKRESVPTIILHILATYILKKVLNYKVKFYPF